MYNTYVESSSTKKKNDDLDVRVLQFQVDELFIKL